jgi:hypothetical protein
LDAGGSYFSYTEIEQRSAKRAISSQRVRVQRQRLPRSVERYFCNDPFHSGEFARYRCAAAEQSSQLFIIVEQAFWQKSRIHNLIIDPGRLIETGFHPERRSIRIVVFVEQQMRNGARVTSTRVIPALPLVEIT